ncbi:hypothetical protein OKA05_11240 [Luteolibacter arcticus]|uniref:Porin n=1 Tax=Luteolibacter arcticus TaxID=1581411 RepID=A0ABT3GHZ9_9BACT|nr:hypothetical protein [Luteolibacter arcticus]MCW1923128.1 hypothetical protein [Luteolibacter arcticus]
MKSFKYAALGALSIASVERVAAQGTAPTASTVIIHFAASNGDRNATQRALSKILTNWNYRGLDGSATGAGGQSQNITNAVQNSNFGTWNGFINGTQHVIVRTNYAGALAGLAHVADPTFEARFDETNGVGSGSIPANPIDPENTEDYLLSTVDFGLSTNFHATSPFKGTYGNPPRTYNDTIKETNVGISPLGFYASPGFPADNITTQQVNQLYSAGYLPLASFTGNSADLNKVVFAIGRNTGAGQRFGAIQETGISGLANLTVWQPQAPAANGNDGLGNPIYGDHPNYDSNKSINPNGWVAGGVVNSHAPWGTESNSGITASGGYNSGANLAVALTYTLGSAAYSVLNDERGITATGGYYIGYVTPGDGNGRVLGQGLTLAQRPQSTRGVQLKYNGVDNTPANIKNGKYSLWLYNRVVEPVNGVVGKLTDPSPTFRQEFVDTLKEQILETDAATGGGILLDDTLKVERFEDGGIVTFK